jgi:hypothetical protein
MAINTAPYDPGDHTPKYSTKKPEEIGAITLVKLPIAAESPSVPPSSD